MKNELSKFIKFMTCVVRGHRPVAPIWPPPWQTVAPRCADGRLPIKECRKRRPKDRYEAVPITQYCHVCGKIFDEWHEDIYYSADGMVEKRIIR